MSVTSDLSLTGNVLLLFKTDLQQEQEELTHAIDKSHNEMRALGDREPGDVIDQSCGNSSKEAMFAVYSQNRTQLRKVQAALRRIATGEFGICTVCGAAIGLKRLQALPWTNNCIECQEQSENERVH